jgi:phage virion morphogenesis protein
MSLEVSIAGLPGLQERLRWLANPPTDKLLKKVGQKAAEQTRDRIRDQKKSPEGERWSPWSPRYAKTRKAGQALLFSSGRLLKSIDSEVVAEGAEVGSDLVYATAQQLGREDRHLPARPFLGVSDRNETALSRIVEKFFERMAA